MSHSVVFFERDRERMHPLAFTRPLSHFRIGIHSIQERWELAGFSCSNVLPHYLQQEFPLEDEGECLFVDASVLPSPEFMEEVSSLKTGEGLMTDGRILAFRSDDFWQRDDLRLSEAEMEYLYLERPWDLFLRAGKAIEWDYPSEETRGQDLPDNVTVIGENIFVEEGARLQACILNSETGPIYIGKDAEVMEGAIIRGPFSLGEGSVVKMGAKIYGPTSIGPHCKVGGEVSNSIFFGYSNKGHDGFIGNSVIGEWCNFGADTNISNLKNNYSEVRVWSYKEKDFVESDQQFCGLIMGDHSKTSINSMLNTGTVVGVACNLFGSGFPSKFVPSFSWGMDGDEHNFSKAMETAERMMERRGVTLGEGQKAVLSWVAEHDKPYRHG
jgi:UDP-N-acetylglucosamine diphosphorylase/glucosamine-1-phosphate N-acetyltransferase